ncbi:MAG: SPOR domain-containing protein [Methylococcales bacterium]|nr:SPOR domain-containing protein [Methylococcales bacterium]
MIMGNDTNTEQADKEDDKITNVMPIKETNTSTSDHEEDEVVYELIEEKSDQVENSAVDESSAADENLAADENSWQEQIKQLQETQALMALQLESAFTASDRLARQLKKERHARRASVTSYVALTMGGLALIIGATSAFFAGSLQRDVTELSTTISTLEQHKHPSDPINVASTKYIHARLDDLAIKLNKVFAEQEATEKKAKLSSSVTNLPDKENKNKAVVKPKTITPPILETTVPAKIIKLEDKTVKKNLTTEPIAKPPTIKPQEKKEPIRKPKVQTELIPDVIKNKPEIKPVIKKEWVVALGSYKNSLTASKNANEYRKAGVPVVISKVNTQGQTWHRLLTKPFSSQQEATLYAERVKNQLKIESILVTKQ